MLGGRVGLWPQGRVGPVQLVDLRGRAPGEVLLAGLGEQVVAGVFEAVGEVEAGRVFGDQGPMPGPLPLGDLAPRGVEGEDGGAEVADRPGPLGLDQPQQVQEVRPARPRRGRPATASPRPVRPADAALVTAAGAGLPGEGQPAQQVGHGGRVEAGGSRQQRHRRRGVPRQAGRSPKMAAASARVTCAWSSASGLSAYRSGDCLTGRGGGFAAQHAGQPPVAVEPLAGLLVAGTPHEGQPGLHLGDAAVQRRRAVQQEYTVVW